MTRVACAAAFVYSLNTMVWL